MTNIFRVSHILQFISQSFTRVKQKQSLKSEGNICRSAIDQLSLLLFLEMIEAMDPQADPCEDFYQYACGGWIKSNSIPDSQNVYNRFHELINQNTKTLIKLLTNLIEKNDTSTVSD